MRIEIEIPKEFECDYNEDKFDEFFGRVLSDIVDGTTCGRYERETAEMLQKAFEESKVAYDVEAKVAELEKEKVHQTFCDKEVGFNKGIRKAIEIVRGKE